MTRIFYGWWVVLATSLITVYVGGVVFSGFTAFVDPIREEFGWTSAQVSFAISLRGLEMGIFAPLVGFLVDRYSPRKLVLLGTVTIGAGLILTSYIQTLTMFYGSILVIAFGAGGCAAVVFTKVVIIWFRKKVGVALALMGSGVGMGGVLIPIIVWLIDLYQWRTTFVILGFGMLLIGIPLSLIIRDKPELYGLLPDGEKQNDAHQRLEPDKEAVPFSLKNTLKNTAFIKLITAEMMRSIQFGAISLHIMPYLVSLGMLRHVAGYVAGAIPVLSIAGRFLLGWLGDRFNKKVVLTWCFIIKTLGVLVFCYLESKWLIVPFLLLYPLGMGGANVLRAAFLMEHFGTAGFGKMIGILMGAASFGGIVGPLIAGWAFDVFGTYHYIWLVYFGIMVLSTGLIISIRGGSNLHI